MNSFWNGKRVLLTSATSFLGTWTALSLRHLGATIFGVGDPPTNQPNFFEICGGVSPLAMSYVDLRDEAALRDVLNFAQADVILHLGEIGRLHDEERGAIETVSKVVLGTTTLLELLKETASVRSVVVVSSDKVYARSPEVPLYSEQDSVDAQGVPVTARLSAELLALSYRKSVFNPDKYNKHKIALATARLEAPIGGGDFDERSFAFQAIRALKNDLSLDIRHPHSQRSWIHVLDQVAGILALAQRLQERGPKLAPTYNLGSLHQATVGEVCNQWRLKAGREMQSFPAQTLSIHTPMSSALALQDLGWQSRLSLQESLDWVWQWYDAFLSGSLDDVHEKQVREYFSRFS